MTATHLSRFVFGSPMKANIVFRASSPPKLRLYDLVYPFTINAEPPGERSFRHRYKSAQGYWGREHAGNCPVLSQTRRGFPNSRNIGQNLSTHCRTSLQQQLQKGMPRIDMLHLGLTS